MTGRGNARGFTLIEVLVAFMILVLCLSVLFRIFSGGMRNVALSGDYARAVLVAQARLAAAGVNEPLVEGETWGEAGERYRWHRIVERHIPWEDGKHRSEPVLGYRVTVEVEWDGDRQARRIGLSSLKLDSRPAGGGRS